MAEKNYGDDRYIGESPPRSDYSQVYSGIWNLNTQSNLIKSNIWYASDSYWICTLGGSGDEVGTGLSIDPNGNIYICGTTTSQGQGQRDAITAKFHRTGLLRWQRIAGTIDDNECQSISCDSAGNSYTLMSGPTILKYSYDGVLQWKKQLSGSGMLTSAMDLNDNLLLGGTDYFGGQFASDGIFIRLNSSGTIIEQYRWSEPAGYSGGGSYITSLVVDKNNGIYFFGNGPSPGPGAPLIWGPNLNKYFDGGSYNAWKDGAVDINLNTYACCSVSDNSMLVKYSNNTQQWAKTLGGSGSETAFSVDVDLSGNVYICGTTTSQGSGGSDVFIAKYDTNGNLQWQRTLGGTGTENVNCIKVLPNNRGFCICGTTTSQGPGGSNIFIACLPLDGTMTGTYGGLSYSSSTLTDSTSSLTSASVSYIAFPGTGYTVSNSAYTTSTSTLSSSYA